MKVESIFTTPKNCSSCNLNQNQSPLLSMVTVNGTYGSKRKSSDSKIKVVIIATYEGNKCTLLTYPLHDQKHRSKQFRKTILFEREILSVGLVATKKVNESLRNFSTTENENQSDYFYNLKHNVILFVHTQCGRLWRSRVNTYLNCSDKSSDEMPEYIDGNIAFANGRLDVYSNEVSQYKDEKNDDCQNEFKMVECVEIRKPKKSRLLIGMTHFIVSRTQENEIGNKFKSIVKPEFILIAASGGLEPPKIYLCPTDFSIQNDAQKSNSITLERTKLSNRCINVESFSIHGMEDHESRTTHLSLFSKSSLGVYVWKALCDIWGSSGELINDPISLHKSNDDSLQPIYEGACMIGSEDGTVHCSLIFIYENLPSTCNQSFRKESVDSKPNYLPKLLLHATSAREILNLDYTNSEAILSVLCLPGSRQSKKQLLIVGKLGSLHFLNYNLHHSSFCRMHTPLPSIGVWRSVTPYVYPAAVEESRSDAGKFKMENCSDYAIIAVLDSGASFLFPLHFDLNINCSQMSGLSPVKQKLNELDQFRLPIRKEMSFVSSSSICSTFDGKYTMYASFASFRGAVIFAKITPSYSNKEPNQKGEVRETLINLIRLQDLEKRKASKDEKTELTRCAMKAMRSATRVISEIRGHSQHLNSCSKQPWTAQVVKPDGDRTCQSRTNIKFSSPIFSIVNKASIGDRKGPVQWNKCCHVLQSIPPNHPNISELQQITQRRRWDLNEEVDINVVFGGVAQSYSESCNQADHAKEKDDVEFEISIWDRFPCTTLLSIQGMPDNNIDDNCWTMCQNKFEKVANVAKIKSRKRKSNPRSSHPLHQEKHPIMNGWVKKPRYMNSSKIWSSNHQNAANKKEEIFGYVIPIHSEKKTMWNILSELIPSHDDHSNEMRMNSILEPSSVQESYNKDSVSLQTEAENQVRAKFLNQSYHSHCNQMPIDLENKMMRSVFSHNIRSVCMDDDKSIVCSGCFSTSLDCSLSYTLSSFCKDNIAGLDSISIVPSKSTSGSGFESSIQKFGFAFIAHISKADMDAINPLLREAILERLMNDEYTSDNSNIRAVQEYSNCIKSQKVIDVIERILKRLKNLRRNVRKTHLSSIVDESLRLYLEVRALDILIAQG